MSLPQQRHISGNWIIGIAMPDLSPTDPKKYETRLEDALCSAICIIRNEAGIAETFDRKQAAANLRKWSDELIEESGIDFDAALDRISGPESMILLEGKIAEQKEKHE